MLPKAQFPIRRPMRLPGYDYSEKGAYFVTLVSHRRSCLFGSLESEQLTPSDMGRIVEEEWNATQYIRREIELGSYVLMPNHLHALVVIKTKASGLERQTAERVDGKSASGPRRRSLSALIGGFKGVTTKRCRANGLLAHNSSLWQRGFYEHIVRNDVDWNAIGQYIAHNPSRWLEDRERLPDAEWQQRMITQRQHT